MATPGLTRLELAVVGAALCGAAAMLWAPERLDMWRVVTALSLVGLAIWIAVEDALTLALPDGGILAIALVGGAWRLAVALETDAVWTGVLGTLMLDAVVAGGSLWALREFFYRRRGIDGLGFGDVKLAAACSVMLGLTWFAWALLAASLSALLLASYRRSVASADRFDRIAFGAFLAPSCVLVWIFSQWPGLLPSAGGYFGQAVQ